MINGNLFALLPLLIFMFVMVGISIFVRNQQAGKSFVNQYFIGNHDLGGFVLAMTTVATYSSVSSFVGGPGMAFKIGFGWIYMAVVQVTAIFLVLIGGNCCFCDSFILLRDDDGAICWRSEIIFCRHWLQL